MSKKSLSQAKSAPRLTKAPPVKRAAGKGNSEKPSASKGTTKAVASKSGKAVAKFASHKPEVANLMAATKASPRSKASSKSTTATSKPKAKSPSDEVRSVVKAGKGKTEVLMTAAPKSGSSRRRLAVELPTLDAATAGKKSKVATSRESAVQSRTKSTTGKAGVLPKSERAAAKTVSSPRGSTVRSAKQGIPTSRAAKKVRAENSDTDAKSVTRPIGKTEIVKGKRPLTAVKAPRLSKTTSKTHSSVRSGPEETDTKTSFVAPDPKLSAWRSADIKSSNAKSLERLDAATVQVNLQSNSVPQKKAAISNVASGNNAAPAPAAPHDALAKDDAVKASMTKEAVKGLPGATATAPGKPAEKAVPKPGTHRTGFKTSEFIVYPAHGVGQIIAIEEQEVAGFKLELFVINFVKDKMTLKVPLPKVVEGAIRKLADADTVRKALDTLTGRARVKRTMWSRRAQEYEAKINSGDLHSIAEVVRDLYRSDAQPEQSYSERQLYEAALDRMGREIAAVQKLTETEALKLIESQLQKGPRRGGKADAEGDVDAADSDVENDADSEGDVEEAA